MQAIDNLADNPRPNGYTKLTGRSGYRIRVGSYRIIYNVFDNNLVIEVVNIGSRGGIYED
jgi:mRNA interferase RelE/StbE